MGKSAKFSPFLFRRLFPLGMLVLMIWVTPELSECQPDRHDPVEVRLLSRNPNVCIGQSEVALEAIITNTTESEIEISPQGVAHIISVQKFEGEKVAERGGLRDIEYNKWINISSHGSQFVPFTLAATDQFSLGGLLDSPGLLQVRIGFLVVPRKLNDSGKLNGTVYTNFVLLRVKKCGE